MKLKIYQVDAFANEIFSGNPAAVVPLEEWLEDEVLQNIAMENNLSETAFFVKKGNKYHIRWMTPTEEVPLCGHATLASAFIIFNYLEKDLEEIILESLSGDLKVTRDNDLITLNFPANIPAEKEPETKLLDALKIEPVDCLYNKSYLLVYKSEEEVYSIQPDYTLLAEVDSHVVIVTAPGKKSDFVSRVFAPAVGIDEDPVTGYAHTLLIPFWAETLEKADLHALQISKRGGELFCKNLGEGRVEMAGKGALFLEGEIYI